jgi:hypothetical protein
MVLYQILVIMMQHQYPWFTITNGSGENNVDYDMYIGGGCRIRRRSAEMPLQITIVLSLELRYWRMWG